MGGGASSWRKAAKKIGCACASFTNDETPPPKTISCSSAAPEGEAVAVKKVVVDKSLCAICLEPLGGGGGGGGGGGETIFTAQCTHAFHLVCISSNVRHGSLTCPICRAQWSHLPRDPTAVAAAASSCNADPVLRILDDSIATSRVNRRSFLRSTRYNDDDPVDLEAISAAVAQPDRPRLHLAVATDNEGRPYLSVRLTSQPATDLVLIANPNGPHLRLLKQSMALVVFSLREVDRLAIVTYAATATRALPLRRMSPQGRRAALQVIDRLFYAGEGGEPTEGLKKGLKILDDRAHRNTLACMLHLSDSPTRSYICDDLQFPIPIHRFHIGFGFVMSSNGLVMHEFEEFLVRLLGAAVGETQLRIGGEEDGRLVRLGELRGGNERRVLLDFLPNDEEDCQFIPVGFSYVEGGGGADQRLMNGEAVVRIKGKSEINDDGSRSDIGRVSDSANTIGRSSCVERWDYLDPFMARRWAKHLHGYYKV